ncbi:penicillin-binding protein PBP2X [Streptococcus suis]|uniref:penicillin-binding protein PBP2X n=1 Tax=Streptococcus suis TaxID=1307 RepID=UPI00041F0B5B|nr:penicillin-binding protein PBP2X [Streptococcus suis]MBM0195039.1 penicillin-binding protein PBP2X [Streptococcus suis]MBM7316257.1 penicillin-binding protein PBP2X [Streptococcus suis]MBO4115607.1 penicillin-binding protein PBP2X [Streptococcus suis]MBO4117462.1 penicillin-binding protein PBP2X [Streptococcus suis]MBO4124498.1 penicillin-binding protein PBP2X [Streptococcus suis]
MPRRNNKFLKYILRNRYVPSKNRRRVGQHLLLLTVFVFFIFLINFAFIIGTDSRSGVSLSERAAAVHQQEVTVQARRGTIYDRTGIPIAEDSTTYTIYAIIDTDYVSEFKEVLYVEATQFSKVAEILNKHLGMETDYVLQQLRQPELKQVYFGTLGKNISYNTMTTIQEEMKAAGIEGIAFNASPGRMYPNGNFASIFVGLANLIENKDGSHSLQGMSGMEYYLNDILAGQDGKVVYEKDSQGRVLPGTEKVETETVNGQDVYTTISADLQRSLETNMDTFFNNAKGKYANATLVSAKTGEILATTQRPSYDPDTKEGLGAEGLLERSLLYQEAFEPGSTMKVLTVASAIDNGTFDPNAYYTNNEYVIADAKINDWTLNAGQSAVTLNFAQGFSLSSNVGMTLLQQEMGDEKWLNYLAKFRYGSPTRFGMGDEAPGMVPEDNIVSIAMSSFGHGISANQAQMLRSFTAIANNGIMLEPKFISALYDPNTDTARLSKVEEVGNPVSEKAANDTLGYMINVGTDPVFGTLYSYDLQGPSIVVDGYDVAVKSGSAEIAGEDGQGYIKGAYINSVVAMVPAEDPEFIMYVTIRQPESLNVMSWRDIVNPTLKEAMLLKDSLNLDSAAPALSQVTTETEYKLPDLIGKSPGETAEELRRELVQPVILGNGSEIKNVSVEKGSVVAANQQILLLTNKFETMPDLYALTKENMDLFAEWTGIEVTYKGTGSKVVDQSVEVGTALKNTKKITITLGD